MFWLDCADGHDALPFLIDGEDTISYEQLFISSDELFGALKRGVVGILCGRNRETITAYIGALRHKHVPLLLNNELSEKQLDTLLSLYKADYLFAPSDRFLQSYASVLQHHNYSLSERISGANALDPHPDLAVLMPTSGSTGDPKCVRLSYQNIESCTQSIVNYLSLDSDRRAISLLPLHYSYGLSVLNSIMGARGSYLLSVNSPLTRSFWADIVRFGVTDFSAVPFVYESLKRMRFSEDVLASLKVVTQAGGRLAPSLSSHFHSLFSHYGIRYFTMYGQTEAAPRISYLTPEDAVRKIGSVGRVLDIGSVKIASAQGLEDEGELIYSGPNVCLGYARNRNDLAKGDEFFGVLNTGDIARIDDEGFIYITGRSKRAIKVNGVSVNLDYIQSRLQDKGHIVYTIGRENKICLAVQKGQADAVLNLAKTEFDFHSTVWQVGIFDTIPRTVAGKPDYGALRAMFVKDDG